MPFAIDGSGGVTWIIVNVRPRFVTETSSGSIALYVGSVLVAAPLTIAYGTSPWSSPSSTPVIVIVCALAQFAAVNVSDD